jgi:peptide-methionine (R)-S-oxide reductase
VNLLWLAPGSTSTRAADGDLPAPRKVVKTDREWAKQLTRAQYLVTRQKVTEPAFSGKLLHNHARGIYECVCCDAPLFSSKAKFESGTGWPSFWTPISPRNIDRVMDYHGSEPRVEVLCSRCGAHLGHVFPDGPPPTGMRFCMNSLALKFVKETKAGAKSAPMPMPETPASSEDSSTSSSPPPPPPDASSPPSTPSP